MPRFAGHARVLPYAVFVSIILFLLGLLFLVASHLVRPEAEPARLASDILRDLGIVLCSIGLISVLYELLIRGQLIADYNNTLQEILDPDTKKLGVTALYRDRDDKTMRGRSLDAMLRVTRKEMFCLGLGFYQFLPEKRDLLIAKIREGCSFKFLIFNTQSKNAEALDDSLGYGNRSLIGFLETQQAYFVNFTKLLSDEGFGDRFEVRTYDCVPTFGAMAVDPSAPDGFLILELYGCGVEGAVCPGIELVPKGSHWHSFYERQLNELWRGAQPLPSGSAKLAAKAAQTSGPSSPGAG